MLWWCQTFAWIICNCHSQIHLPGVMCLSPLNNLIKLKRTFPEGKKMWLLYQQLNHNGWICLPVAPASSHRPQFSFVFWTDCKPPRYPDGRQIHVKRVRFTQSCKTIISMWNHLEKNKQYAKSQNSVIIHIVDVWTSNICIVCTNMLTLHTKKMTFRTFSSSAYYSPSDWKVHPEIRERFGFVLYEVVVFVQLLWKVMDSEKRHYK